MEFQIIGRLAFIVIKQNTSQTLLDLSYNYNRGNSKGSINGKTGQLTNIVNNLDRNKDRVYEFDTLGRLITAKGGVAAGGSGVANWTQNYAFDRYGNRTSVTASGVTANNAAVPTDGLPSLAYQTTSNRINTNGYEYDLAGAQTRGQSPTGVWQRFEYDAAGRLVKIKDDAGTVLESHTYGASRQRIINETSTQRTYYAWGGSSVLCEYVENSSSPTSPVFTKSYIYAGSRLLSTQTNNNGTEITEFHHPDRLGTKLVTNNSANTSFEQATLPFGTALDAETSGTTNQRFTSYDRSTPASLDYAVNRSYSSGQGRFTTVDPLQGGASRLDNPQTMNLFSYAQNNPIDYTDPSGLTVEVVCSWIVEDDGSWSNYECEATYHEDPKPQPKQDPGGGGGGGGNFLGVDTHRPLETFGRSDNCDDLKKEIAELEQILADRKEDGRRWAFNNNKSRPDDGHQKRINNSRNKLNDLKDKYKKKGCGDDNKDPEPERSPVVLPVPKPAPTPSKESQERRNNAPIWGHGATAMGAVGTGLVVYVVGKKVLGVGLLFTPAAPAGVLLIATP